MSLIPLRKPLGGLTSLREDVPHISDLAALLAGVKPVVYLDVGEEDRGYIDQLCRALKLVSLQPETELAMAGYHQSPRNRMLLLGRDPEALKAAARSWGRNSLDLEWGALLGYPKCCVKAYGVWARARMRLPYLDLVQWTWAHSNGNSYPFLLNNVFNFFSRCAAPAWQDEDHRRYLAIHRANERLSLPTLNVISWHPCSFRCAESVSKAETIFSFLLEYAPAYAARLKRYLAHPILHFDKYEFVVLDAARVREDEVEYKRLLPPFSLLPAEFVRQLAEGRRVVLEGGAVKLMPSERRIARGGSALLLDFR